MHRDRLVCTIITMKAKLVSLSGAVGFLSRIYARRFFNADIDSMADPSLCPSPRRRGKVCLRRFLWRLKEVLPLSKVERGQCPAKSAAVAQATAQRVVGAGIATPKGALEAGPGVRY